MPHQRRIHPRRASSSMHSHSTLILLFPKHSQPRRFRGTWRHRMRKAWCSKTKAIIIARTTFQPCIRVLLPKANSTTPIRSLAPLFSTATHSRRARFLTRARSSPTRFRARARSYPSELQDQAPRTRTRAPLSNLRCFGSDSVSRVSLSRGFALVICAVRALPGSVPLARMLFRARLCSRSDLRVLLLLCNRFP